MCECSTLDRANATRVSFAHDGGTNVLNLDRAITRAALATRMPRDRLVRMLLIEPGRPHSKNAPQRRDYHAVYVPATQKIVLFEDMVRDQQALERLLVHEATHHIFAMAIQDPTTRETIEARIDDLAREGGRSVSQFARDKWGEFFMARACLKPIIAKNYALRAAEETICEIVAERAMRPNDHDSIGAATEREVFAMVMRAGSREQ